MNRPPRPLLALPALLLCAPASALPRALEGMSLTAPVSATGGERAGLGLATVDVAGIPSMDALGSPNNAVVLVWVGPTNILTGVGWDVVLQTIAPESRLGEISLRISRTTDFAYWVNFRAGFSAPFPGGPMGFSSDGEIFKLGPSLPDLVAGPDGYLRLEFYDQVDNAPGEADGLWVSGVLHLQTARGIPPEPVSPGAIPLFAVAGVAALRGRRRRPG